MIVMSAVLRNALMKTCGFVIVATAVIVLGPSAARAQNVSFGERLFRDKADCQFCHGIDGNGRGDPRSPGRAANLHETRLNREQLIEVIAAALSAFDAADQTRDRGSRRLHHHDIRRKIATERDRHRQSPASLGGLSEP